MAKDNFTAEKIFTLSVASCTLSIFLSCFKTINNAPSSETEEGRQGYIQKVVCHLSGLL